MKQKKQYQKPTMTVFELKQQAPLVCVSGGEYPGWNSDDI